MAAAAERSRAERSGAEPPPGRAVQRERALPAGGWELRARPAPPRPSRRREAPTRPRPAELRSHRLRGAAPGCALPSCRAGRPRPPWRAELLLAGGTPLGGASQPLPGRPAAPSRQTTDVTRFPPGSGVSLPPVLTLQLPLMRCGRSALRPQRGSPKPPSGRLQPRCPARSSSGAQGARCWAVGSQTLASVPFVLVLFFPAWLQPCLPSSIPTIELEMTNEVAESTPKPSPADRVPQQHRSPIAGVKGSQTTRKPGHFGIYLHPLPSC